MIGLLGMLLLGPPALAAKLATPTNHAEWRWRTLQTEHFDVVFPTSVADPSLGAEAAARRIADRADAIWLRMGDELDWFPIERIRVVVVDDTDDLRAWAWPLRGTVVISAAPGIELGRGRSRGDPLIDVFAHELAHVMIHKRMGSHSEVLGFGSEGLGQGAVGGGAVGLGVPVGPTVPQWWSEGGAEYLAARVGHGWWSPARDAGVRVSALEDRLLSWDELQVAVDKGDAGDGERAYQQGFAFFRWLEATYGEDFFAELLERSAARGRVDPNHALAELTGERPRALYARHVEALRREARRTLEAREAEGLAVGAELWAWTPAWAPADLDALDRWEGQPRRKREDRRAGSGTRNLHPRWSSDGRWLGESRAGWVRVRRSSEGIWPALSDSELSLARTASRRAASSGVELWIPGRFGSGFAFVPGRDEVVVSGPAPLLGPEDGWERSRLYRVDLEPTGGGGRKNRPPSLRRLRERARPIPGTERGFDPAISPDGKQLAFVRIFAGGQELVICDLDDCRPEAVDGPSVEASVWMPSWSPDGSALVVAAHVAHRNDLWILQEGDWRQLTDDRYEATDPWWAEDGIYFAADVDGVHDVFRIDPDGGEVDRITRVTGMAATPSITPEGHLLFAHRTGHGWKSQALRREAFLAQPEPRLVAVDRSTVAVDTPAPPRVAAPYRVVRSTLVLGGAPELRVVAEPADAGAMAGGWLLTRDAAEHYELAVHALAGQDALVDGALTLRLLPVDLTLWGGWEDDRRWIGTPQDRVRERVQLGATGLEVRAEPLPDALALFVEGQLRAQWARGLTPSRQALVRSRQFTGGLVVGDADFDEQIGSTGGAMEARGALGRSGPDAGDWQRVEGDLAGQVRLGPTVVFGGAGGGWIGGEPSMLELLRAGGDAPRALRLARPVPSRSLPGFAPRSIAGTRLAVLSTAVGLPIRDLRRLVGPVYLDDLELRARADIGRAWTGSGSTEPVLFDVGGEVRLSAIAGEQPWDCLLRIARGFGEPAPTGVWTDAIRGEGATRVVLGLGTGW